MARAAVILKVIAGLVVLVICFLIATDQVDAAVTITVAIFSGIGSIFGNIAEFITEIARRLAGDG